MEQQTNTLAMASLVLGIVAVVLTIVTFCCCYGCPQVPFSIGAFVTGGLAISQINADPEGQTGKNFAFGGIGAAALAMVLNIIIFILVFALNIGAAALG